MSKSPTLFSSDDEDEGNYFEFIGIVQFTRKIAVHTVLRFYLTLLTRNPLKNFL